MTSSSALDDTNLATATLRVMSTRRKAADISSALRSVLTKTVDVGDVISSPQKGGRKVRKHTLWALDGAVPNSADLTERIAWLADFLEQRRKAISRLKADCDIDIFCSFTSYNGQGSIELPNSILTRLGRSGVDLAFDLYFIDTE